MRASGARVMGLLLPAFPRRSGRFAPSAPQSRPGGPMTREAFLVDGVRTPIGRYGGALAGVRPDDLAANVISSLVNRTALDPALIDDVILGCANQAGEDNRNVARMAVLLSGLPDS